MSPDDTKLETSIQKQKPFDLYVKLDFAAREPSIVPKAFYNNLLQNQETNR